MRKPKWICGMVHPSVPATTQTTIQSRSGEIITNARFQSSALPPPSSSSSRSPLTNEVMPSLWNETQLNEGFCWEYRPWLIVRIDSYLNCFIINFSQISDGYLGIASTHLSLLWLLREEPSSSDAACGRRAEETLQEKHTTSVHRDKLLCWLHKAVLKSESFKTLNSVKWKGKERHC